jgi:nickel transport protein
MRPAILQRLSAIAGAVVFVLFTVPAALAHNFLLDVYPFFGTVEGAAFFSNGAVPREGTPVEVFGPDGAKVSDLQTDADGFFSYDPTVTGEHRFTANAGDGHVAEFALQVTAEEFPDLAAAGGSPETTGAETGTPPLGEPEGAVDAAIEGAAPTVVGGVTAEEVQGIVNQTAVGLGRQIRDLTDSINESRERATFMDILGGIGYIVGLFGIGFFVMALTRLRAAGLAMSGTGAAKTASAARPDAAKSDDVGPAATKPAKPQREAAE